MEVETKFRVEPADHARLRQFLGGSGDVVTQRDTYFALPDQTQSLRIREDDDGARITFKVDHGSEGEVTVRHEFEPNIPSEDIPDWTMMFIALGAKVDTVVEKMRETLTFQDVVVTLDIVAGLGHFVEVEVISHDPVEAAMRIEAAITKLGLESADRCNGSYRYMLKLALTHTQMIEEATR